MSGEASDTDRTEETGAEKHRWLRATDVGEFVRHNSCLRRFALGYDNQANFRTLPFSSNPYHTLDIVLSEEGQRRETEWAVHLENQGISPLRLPTTGEHPGVPWSSFRDALKDIDPGREVFEREVRVRGRIGAFTVEGRIDFAILRWKKDTPQLWLVECKASRRDRTYQRIQAILYLMLVRRLIQDQALVIGGMSQGASAVVCSVVRIDETRNTMLALDDLSPLSDAESLEQDALNLLARDGALVRALDEDLEQLPYQLTAGCDDCQFTVHCLPESARCDRLELLGIEPSLVRHLMEAEVTNLGELAALQPGSDNFRQLQETTPVDLEVLSVKARVRRSTLPGQSSSPSSWELMRLPHQGYGQLPTHTQRPKDEFGRHSGEHQLIRVFLTVCYDYAENRVCALCAHITRSEGRIFTPRQQAGDQRKPASGLSEWHGGRNITEVQGEDIVEMRTTPWVGHYDLDTGAEASLIQSFFSRVVEAIQIQAAGERAPLHFYFWSKNDLNALIEACTRAGQGLLHHLRELFGCRESLEQLIYSSIQQEFTRRYARGWTGSSMELATSLNWFGKRYHWLRDVGGKPIDFAQLFRRDIFDAVEQLPITEQGQWAAEGNGRRHPFELRSNHTGGITMPYWHALWGLLPTPEQVSDTKPALARSLRDYHHARQPGAMRHFLRARTHALRWLEERMQPGNNSITKPLISPEELPTFRLSTRNALQSAVDFLRLDHHMGFGDWLQRHLSPPYVRVIGGVSLPVKNVHALDPHRTKLAATLDCERFGLSVTAFRARSSIIQGAFVRLNESSPEPHEAQKLNHLQYEGHTCVIDVLDWSTGRLEMSIIRNGGKRSPFILPSQALRAPMAFATLDDSQSRFVEKRVDKQLRWIDAQKEAHHVTHWFDPVRPLVPPHPPLKDAQKDRLRDFLNSAQLSSYGSLLARRVDMILAGMESRIQLIQGPPGTGKTTLSAVAILTRLMLRRRAGERILVTAHTHTAVDTLLKRLETLRDDFQRQATEAGFKPAPIALLKVCKDDDDGQIMGENILKFKAKGRKSLLQRLGQDHVLIIGASTGGGLKLAEALSKTGDNFQVPLLVVDEASMMVCAHFLALASLLSPEGSILMAGDNRQLAPIVSHDWEKEDRPPAQLYRMHESAFDAVANMIAPREEHIGLRQSTLTPASVRRDGLQTTYRLPPSIRRLIQPLYDKDAITLLGPGRRSEETPMSNATGVNAIWQSGHGVYLVLHDEDGAQDANPTEVALIQHILNAGLTLNAVPDDSVAIITPHRAQRALLKTRIDPERPPIRVIDTVERLQGGEAPTIMYSATASDPVSIARKAEFILGLERSNVAFSRTQERLIVVCSRTLLDHIPMLVEHYDCALLWKFLRQMCTRQVGGGEIGWSTYKVLVPS